MPRLLACPCGRQLRELLPGVWLCERELGPHLWRGGVQVLDPTANDLAAMARGFLRALERQSLDRIAHDEGLPKEVRPRD